jgi:HD-GYP domain-containing protein (c-di-GMP phosphodiesterase class II)
VQKFYPVRLNTLRKDDVLAFDVYVSVGEKFVQYIHAQDVFEGERLDKLKNKGVRKLFIPTEQEKNYLQYLEKALDQLSNTSHSIEDRTQLAHDSLVTAAENAVVNFETEAGLRQQQDHLTKIANFVDSDRKVIKQIMENINSSFDNNHHAANVSSLCMSVAAKAGLTDKQEVSELSIAALVHDVGKERFKENYDVLGDKMSAQQKQAYRAHVSDGVTLLQGKPFISPRILGLVAAHEELGQGRGYPEKKDVFQLPLCYQILIMCNRYDHFKTQQQLPTMKAIDAFFEKHSNDFPDELVTVLASVLT